MVDLILKGVQIFLILYLSVFYDGIRHVSLRVGGSGRV